MSLKKLLKTCSVACLSVATSAAWADGSWGVQDSFEGDSPALSHWSGNTNVVAVSGDDKYPTTTPSYGYPIASAGHTSDGKMLAVEGKAICTNTSAATTVKSAQVDFMVKVMAPDEAPEISTDDAGAQIALAAWTNEVATAVDTVPLKLYCTMRSQEKKDWVTLTNAVTTGTWVRVTMIFDYTNNVCRVSMNGNALSTTEGYRLNTKPTGGTNDAKGPWYTLANAPSDSIGTRVSEVKVVGTTCLDDLVITNATLEAYNPYVDANGNAITNNITPTAGGTAIEVSAKMVDESGLTQDEIAAGGVAAGDSLSVLEIAEAGLEVGKGQKFEMKTITPSVPDGSGDSKMQAFAITFPGDHNDNRYEVTVSTDADGKSTLETTGNTYSKEAGGNKWSGTVPVGSNKTIYFHLKAKQPADPE